MVRALSDAEKRRRSIIDMVCLAAILIVVAAIGGAYLLLSVAPRIWSPHG